MFLFSLLLAYFFVPPELRGRVIVIGIAGALLLRAIAIAAGVALIESVEAVVYVFGALLLYVAYRAFRGAAEQSDPSANPVLRLVRRTVSITDDFRGRRLFVREGGRLYGTPLLLVVVAIIVADIAFAVDSIPAAFAVTRDPVVIWTANAFALLGLGSLLVIVELLVRRLRYLDETIALILGFVGIKILAADLVHISDLGSLAIIAALLAGGTVASLVADRLDPPRPVEEATRRPPRARTRSRSSGSAPCSFSSSSSYAASAISTRRSRSSSASSGSRSSPPTSSTSATSVRSRSSAPSLRAAPSPRSLPIASTRPTRPTRQFDVRLAAPRSHAPGGSREQPRRAPRTLAPEAFTCQSTFATVKSTDLQEKCARACPRVDARPLLAFPSS